MKRNPLLYLSVLFTSFFLGACDLDTNLQPIGNWTMSDPVPKPIGDIIVLDEEQPESVQTFEWEPAVTSNRFIVGYRFLLVETGSTDFSDAIMEVIPANSGRALSVSPKASEINYALWAACYPSGEAVDLEWVVVAKAIEKETIGRLPISITPYASEYQPESLYLAGTAIENGSDTGQAIAMREKTKADGSKTGTFEIYTALIGGESLHFRDRTSMQSRRFGGTDGALVACGDEITAPESGIYRVFVDLNENRYEFTKIDRWSLVGDAVEGGWAGDVPLDYQGNGKWEGEIAFFKPYETAGFIFRANGDWGLLLKRIVGSGSMDDLEGDLVMESEAGLLGFEFEDLPGPMPGTYTVILDLSADGPSFTLEPGDVITPPVETEAVIGKTSNPDADAVTGSFDFGSYDIPDQLFLVADGSAAISFVKDGEVFNSEIYAALEMGKTYYLNDQPDGSGNDYNELGDGSIAVQIDQAYQVSVDFSTGKLHWKYYNLKVFHWDEVNGGWDNRDEVPMTYSHPYQFEVTAPLTGGFDIKINSPWDIEFGTDDTELSGTMENKGPNFKGITQSGNYRISITIAEDYSECTYEFIQQ